MARRSTLATVFFVLSCGPGVKPPVTPEPAAPTPDPEVDTRTEVVVLGMIHAEHRTSATYGVDTLREIVARVDPDAVLAEIPPDRFGVAMREFQSTGLILEPRVARFPEYVDVIFPMTKDHDFKIVPCAGWSKAMADDRRKKLAEWKTSRPDETAEVDAAMAAAEAAIAKEGAADDPRFIHSERYDTIVEQGMEPYNRLFNDDLGDGGWDNINAAHFALIEAAIDRLAGPDQRLLITFGAWHKYWFLERLAKRDDIVLRAASDFL